MEHIEEAGIHSGDSACALPPITLGRRRSSGSARRPRRSPRGVGVRGLLNVQYALAADVLYVLEANPRASRTVPFVVQGDGGAAGEGRRPGDARRDHRRAARRGHAAEPPATAGRCRSAAPISVKEAVLPFGRFQRRRHGARPGDALDRRGHGHRRRASARRSPSRRRPRTAALPTTGRAFVSVANRDKRAMIFPVKRLADLGFEILATEGTAEVLRRNGVQATVVRKHYEAGDGDADAVQRILAGEVDLIVNTPFGVGRPARRLRDPHGRGARGVPCITTVQGLAAAVQGIEALVRGEIGVRSLQEHAAALHESPVEEVPEMPPVQVRGEVLSIRRVGAYHALTSSRRGSPSTTRPGHFVAVGGRGRRLRRCCCGGRSRIYAGDERGVYGGTVEIVFAVHGKGTAWLAELRPHDPVDVVGPLGRPFPLPEGAGGRHAGRRRLRRAPLFRWPRGCASAAAGSTSCSAPRPRTGCSGRPGRQADVEPSSRHHRRRLGGRARAGHRRAAGDHRPHRRRRGLRLRADGDAARGQRARAGRAGAHSQCAVEEAMACGIGVCMTCVLPVVGDDGVTRMVRSCVEGPVFLGETVRWDDVGTVPADTLRGTGAHAGRGRGGDVVTQMRLTNGRSDTQLPEVDMSTRLGQVPVPNPVLTASGCAAAGRELDQFFDVTAIGGVVTKSIMHGAAVRPSHPADGRDAERDAQLDRPAGPGHRRRSSPRTCPGCAGAGRERSCRSPAARRGVRAAGHTLAARARASPRSRSTSPAPTSRTAARSSPATRVRRRRWSRPSAGRPRPASRCSPSCRRTSPTSSRSRGRASTPAPTGCR